MPKGFQKGNTYARFAGKKHSEVTKEKMRAARKMIGSPMKDPVTAAKVSATLIKNETYAGEKHPRWKGGDRKDYFEAGNKRFTEQTAQQQLFT